MLKKISFDNAVKLLKNGKIDNLFYLHNNGEFYPVKETDTLLNFEYHYPDLGCFVIEINETNKKFKVEILETYRRYVEVEAQDEDVAYQDIYNKIEEGVIDLPRDGKEYKYERELFVSEVKENE